MLESRSYYHPLERGSKPYKWCVSIFYTFGGYSGSVGHKSRKEAEKWAKRDIEQSGLEDKVKRIKVYHS